MARNSEHAYATLLMTDNYLPGAMVLGHSLKDGGTNKQLIALITPETISVSTIDELKKVYDQIIPIAQVRNTSPGNLYLMGREDLASTFSKIALWTLTQFRKVVYIDADVVALRAPDELFDLKSTFAAVPDVGWPDIFNSGVMALTPNLQDYHALQSLANNGVSFDGADQGLLNMHFSRNLWERLSFIYNCTPSGNYQYAPAYRYFGSQISLIHFIGRQKPWQMSRYAAGFGGVYKELTARWWAIYDKYYGFPTQTTSSQQSSYQATLNQPSTSPASARDSIVQMHVRGEPDFRAPNVSYPSNIGSQQHQPSQPEHVMEQSVPTMIIHHPPEDPPRSFEPERKFSAPHVQWDPARAPPPAQSEPEAANFPDTVYEMSRNTELYKPPTAYPAPPSDMYYEVPKEKPKVHEPPRVIFPWEANQAPATRVFPDEPPLPPVPDPDHKPAPLPMLDTSGTEISPDSTGTSDAQQDPLLPLSTAKSGISSLDFSSYSRINAWDLDPNIGKYAEVWEKRHRRGKNSSAVSLSGIMQRKEGNDRRPSLILTDFPTEIERPSLPVTPAPIRAGGSFWGREQSTEDLPQAEGVPSPQAWDPSIRLEELQRRQSEVFLAGPFASKVLPSREQIASAIAAIEEDSKNQQTDIEVPTPSEETPSVNPTTMEEDSEKQPKTSPLVEETPDLTPATIVEHPKSLQADSKTFPLSKETPTITSTEIEQDSDSRQTDSEALPLSEESPDTVPAAIHERPNGQQTDSEALPLREEIFNAAPATTTKDVDVEQASPKSSAVLEPPTAKDPNSKTLAADIRQRISALDENSTS